MSGNRRLLNYAQASLPLKISLPFILMFLSLWVAGGTVLGQYFSHKLDEKQQARAKELAALVEREIVQKMYTLRRDARILSTKSLIAQHIAEQDEIGLKQDLLPLKAILQTDIIKVVNQYERVLFDSRQPTLKIAQIQAQKAIALLLAGSDVSTIVSSDGAAPPVLIGTAPMKNQQGVIGGILLGTALGDELLAQINESLQENLIVLEDGQVVASTLPADAETPAWSEFQPESQFIKIGEQIFLAQAVHLEGLDESHYNLILLINRAPIAQAKATLWVFILVMGLLGGTLTILGSYWVARKVADPIQGITTIAHKVVDEGDFQLQAPVETPDEIGRLAKALNQLIRWVAEYTHELEVASQTLESRVQDRTRELADTLQELQETQAQLIQTEKMSSLGQMVAGIAHELNNPLSFIQGNIPPLNEYFQDLLDLIETYQTEYSQPSETILAKQEQVDLEFMIADLKKLLDSMKIGTQRVQDIVISLRNYSRLDEATIKDVDIHEGIENTLLLLNHRIKHEVEVIKDYGCLLPIRCSPAQMNQVFTNIIANALDALLEGDMEPKQLFLTTRSHSEKEIQISIRDNGCGIPPEIKDKIFDPFFTTKGIGKGTGLGLGICFKIIQQHKGTLEVHSEVGKGTEFLITLSHDALPLEPEVQSTLAVASR